MAAQYHDIDLDFQRELVAASDYNFRPIHGKVNVDEGEDLEMALRDE
jgi:hypothetical protein